MSWNKISFLLKYGTLDQAKKAVDTADTDKVGFITATKKLLTRMKEVGDPDYEKMRDNHMGNFSNDRIKSSWVVDSEHMKPEHLKTIVEKFPHMVDRVAKNKNTNADVLRFAYEQSKLHPLKIDGDDVRKIIKNPNVPKDVVEHIAKHYEGMGTRAFAQQRLENWKE